MGKPSEYMSTDTALIAICASLILLNPPTISRGLILKAAGVYAAWSAASALGAHRRAAETPRARATTMWISNPAHLATILRATLCLVRATHSLGDSP